MSRSASSSLRKFEILQPQISKLYILDSSSFEGQVGPLDNRNLQLEECNNVFDIYNLTFTNQLPKNSVFAKMNLMVL